MLLVVIAVCIPFAWQRLLPLDLVEFAKSALSAIGFGSNFFFYFSTTEYGADSALLKPLLHTWSLGVEEQFYIVVPIIILVIWKFARASLLPLLIGMLIMSIQFADVMEVRNSELNFFLPFSRFWELFVGSALAFIELKYGRSKNPILTQTMPIIGLSLIAHSTLFFDANTPHPSFQTLIPILGVTLVLAFCSTEDFVGKILSLKPIVGVGLISYSLYLWHFPIFAFGRIFSSNPSNYDKLGWVVLALILSISSYFVIEKTFRDKSMIATKVFSLTALAVASLLSVVFYKIINEQGYMERFPPLFSKNISYENFWHQYKKDGKDCYSRKASFCEEFFEDSLTTVFSVGDSQSSSMSLQLIDKLKQEFNYIEMNHGGCPFLIQFDRFRVGKKDDECGRDYQNLRRDFISSKKKSIIIVSGRYPLYLNGVFFDNQEGGVEKEGFDEEIRGFNFFSEAFGSIEDGFISTISDVLLEGHHVILVYPIPEVGVHVPKHLLKLISNGNFEFEPLTTDFSVYKNRSASTFQLFDTIRSDNIYRVYPHTLFCDKQIKGRCVTHDNDDVFYADDDHPSAKGSEMIVELIIEQIGNAEVNIRGN